ncbi:MAG: FCD domain-containing protein [Gemmatimonas sp.]|nr:FCD domain-containing protein [Gemmatimonas sp.]
MTVAEAPLNASAHAAETIRAAILDGTFEQGMRLKEEKLSRDLGISRTPIREALRTLQAEGLLDILPNHGATVRTYEAEDLADLHELRAVLEGFAAKRAASRITEAQLTRLQDVCKRFHELCDTDDVDSLVEANSTFHGLVIEAAGTRGLSDVVRSLYEPRMVSRLFHHSPRQRRMSDMYHREVAAAISERDPERAGTLMSEHNHQVGDYLLQTGFMVSDRELKEDEPA